MYREARPVTWKRSRFKAALGIRNGIVWSIGRDRQTMRESCRYNHEVAASDAGSPDHESFERGQIHFSAHEHHKDGNMR